jgi:hypothetical protein
MGTTGAPWNIPYVDPTDLVRDFPTDDEAQALAIAAGLSAAGNPGIGSNVVQTVKTDTFSTSSTSFTAVTGLTVTITPSSATSKVLVIARYSLSNSATANASHGQLVKSTTAIYEGDASGSKVRSSSTLSHNNITDSGILHTSFTDVFLDSPGVATAVTYGVRIRAGTSGTAFVGRGGVEADDARFGRFPSSITAIEVAV